MVEGSIRSVAVRLGRAPSTVSREIKRNGGQSDYRAIDADSAAWDRALRPKHCKLVENLALARIVTDKLRLLWSPEQVAGWLKHTYPRDESQHVSHETIYRSLFIQSRGALKKELLQHLRRTRVMRRSRHYTQKTDTQERCPPGLRPERGNEGALRMQQADSEGYTHSSDLEAESSITSLSSAITKAGDLLHFETCTVQCRANILTGRLLPRTRQGKRQARPHC